MSRELIVVDPGPLSLIEDYGRPGLASYGVGPSGAADRESYAWANALVGNHPGSAAIEALLGGLKLRAVGSHWLAVTGASSHMRVDDRSVRNSGWIPLHDGEQLALGHSTRGLRTYIAVRGGITVEPVLGSRSSDILSGIGPPPLQRGQTLPIGPLEHGPLTPRRRFSTTHQDGVVTLRAVLGPRNTRVPGAHRLAHGVWTVTNNSSRVALRLARLERDATSDADVDIGSMEWDARQEHPSEGLLRGCIQLPPSGLPVVFLADHPVTGGYPVIAVLLDADTDRAAQARPGQHVKITLVPGPLDVRQTRSSGSIHADIEER